MATRTQTSATNHNASAKATEYAGKAVNGAAGRTQQVYSPGSDPLNTVPGRDNVVLDKGNTHAPVTPCKKNADRARDYVRGASGNDADAAQASGKQSYGPGNSGSLDSRRNDARRPHASTPRLAVVRYGAPNAPATLPAVLLHTSVIATGDSGGSSSTSAITTGAGLVRSTGPGVRNARRAQSIPTCSDDAYPLAGQRLDEAQAPGHRPPKRRHADQGAHYQTPYASHPSISGTRRAPLTRNFSNSSRLFSLLSGIVPLWSRYYSIDVTRG